MHFLFDGPENSRDTIVLAHGAGGAMDTPFMNTIARGLADRGLRVARFEFPYMAARRTGGKRGAPDREPVLLESWREAVVELGGGSKVIIGGKSMGGRMASMVADDLSVRALVCLGYPFHPPGQPAKLRTKHLEHLKTPTLIVQGERDPFGTREDVAGYKLSRAIRVEWLADGDHSFKPRAASGHKEREHLDHACTTITHFVTGLV